MYLIWPKRLQFTNRFLAIMSKFGTGQALLQRCLKIKAGSAVTALEEEKASHKIYQFIQHYCQESLKRTAFSCLMGSRQKRSEV